MDLLNCCFNMLNINPRRLATAFHSLYQEVHTISPLYVCSVKINQPILSEYDQLHCFKTMEVA